PAARRHAGGALGHGEQPAAAGQPAPAPPYRRAAGSRRNLAHFPPAGTASGGNSRLRRRQVRPMARTPTLGRYIGARFLLAILATMLFCSVLIFLIHFVELLRQSGKYGEV